MHLVDKAEYLQIWRIVLSSVGRHRSIVADFTEHNVRKRVLVVAISFRRIQTVSPGVKSDDRSNPY